MSGYEPENIGTAENSWLQAMQAMGQNTNQAQMYSPDAYSQSYNQSKSIDYAPYLQASQQMGQQYGNLANMAGQQMNQFGQQAQMAQGMQGQLYSGAQNVMNTAFDPQQALYARTQQQVGDQINAGQAQRGLGLSAQGGNEYNQGMSNFNIDWQNQQLSRQSQGLQSAAGASNAGVNQANVFNSALQNQMGAGQNQAMMTGQAAQVPLQAQQTVAGMPAQNANQYMQSISNLNQLQGNQMAQALPYMNSGIGATQFNSKMNAQQNSQLAALGAYAGSALLPYAKSAGTGLMNMFGGAGGVNAATDAQIAGGASAAGDYTPYANMTDEYSDLSGQFGGAGELSDAASIYANLGSATDLSSIPDTPEAWDAVSSFIGSFMGF